MNQASKSNVVPIKPEGSEVSLAYLQTTTTWPGHFTSETTLSATKFPGIHMELRADGLIVTLNNVKAFIPSTNIKLALLK